MKAIISSTYDDNYLFFLPITTWCWNKLGVDVICFLPQMASTEIEREKYLLAVTVARDKGLNIRTIMFNCPKHKEATYAQCSRLYAAALDLPDDEILITSDVDMALFKIPHTSDFFTIVGVDLVPESQVPMCYLSGTTKEWRKIFEINGRGYQQCLDDLLGQIEADHFRGNYWGKDQETAFNQLNKIKKIESHSTRNAHRARPGTQFANNRVDRDDINWRSYVNDDLIDAHLWRPGYTDENFSNIMELLKMKYPTENFQWLLDYREQYLKLINCEP